MTGSDPVKRKHIDFVMARKPRNFEKGGIYHVVKRGVDGRKIFLEPQDYRRFILSLEFFNTDITTNLRQIFSLPGSDPGKFEPAKITKRIEAERERRRKKKIPRLTELMAFALMPNHFHLVMREITEGGISEFMQKIGGYSTYFNLRHERDGGLFQSRFKDVRIETDQQLIIAFVYVHTNPVELVEPQWKDLKVRDPEKALKFLEDYQWSSYRDYIGIPTFPEVTQREFFLELLGGEKGCREAVEDWVRFKAENAQRTDEMLE